MKFLTIALAALFSNASGHKSDYDFKPHRVEYEFDPVRHMRAKKFYKDLVLTEMHNFNEAEQAQLIGGTVGTGICQGVDSFALFDLKGFNTEMILHSGATKNDLAQYKQDVDDSTMLLYRICPKTGKGRF